MGAKLQQTVKHTHTPSSQNNNCSVTDTQEHGSKLTLLPFHCLTSLASRLLPPPPLTFLFTVLCSPLFPSLRSHSSILPFLRQLLSRLLYSYCCAALLLSAPSPDRLLFASSAPASAVTVASVLSPSPYLATLLLPPM